MAEAPHSHTRSIGNHEEESNVNLAGEKDEKLF